jgi:hypothetical protein
MRAGEPQGGQRAADKGERADLESKLYRWFALYADVRRAPHWRLSHAEAKETAELIREATATVGFVPTGPVWTMLSLAIGLGAIFAPRVLESRALAAAESRPESPPESRPSSGEPTIHPAPSGAPAPAPIIRPAPAAPIIRPAPAAPAPGASMPPIGEGISGFGIPGMPVMTLEQRMAPPA